jgi:hypothetical protein
MCPIWKAKAHFPWVFRIQYVLQEGWVKTRTISIQKNKKIQNTFYIKTKELQLRTALVEARKEDKPATGPALAWQTNEPWLCLDHCLIKDLVKKAFVSHNQLMERLKWMRARTIQNVPNPGGRLNLPRSSTVPHSL